MSYYELLADQKKYFHFFYHYTPNAIAHFHSAVEMLIIQNGEQEVVLDGERRILKRGDACFCDRFCVHSYPKKEGVTAAIIIGDKAYFERAFALLGNKTPPNFFHFERLELLETLYHFNKSYENEQKSEEVKQAAFEGSVGILMSAIAENVPFVSRQRNKQESLICDVLLYAETHLEEDISLSALANVFGYSHEHLSRLMHRYLSENWTAYVNRLRVKKAAEILRKNPNNSVLSTALSCGFDSANTFYRAYKKEFGVPPRKNS